MNPHIKESEILDKEMKKKMETFKDEKNEDLVPEHLHRQYFSINKIESFFAEENIKKYKKIKVIKTLKSKKFKTSPFK